MQASGGHLKEAIGWASKSQVSGKYENHDHREKRTEKKARNKWEESLNTMKVGGPLHQEVSENIQ